MSWLNDSCSVRQSNTALQNRKERSQASGFRSCTMHGTCGSDPSPICCSLRMFCPPIPASKQSRGLAKLMSQQPSLFYIVLKFAERTESKPNLNVNQRFGLHIDHVPIITIANIRRKTAAQKKSVVILPNFRPNRCNIEILVDDKVECQPYTPR